MLASSADANTFAGAPWLTWVASVEEDAKLNFTVASGLAVWKALPISVNAPVREAAANTVIVPVAGVVAAGATDDTVVPGLATGLEPLPHAALSTAAAATSLHRRRS